MLVWLIKQTAIDLLLQPFSKIDMWYLKQNMPPPMHKGEKHHKAQDSDRLFRQGFHCPCLLSGNYEEPVEMCLMDEDLRQVAREDQSPGWVFLNEGTTEKPKVGR